jgi:ankyrin repeat protein
VVAMAMVLTLSISSSAESTRLFSAWQPHRSTPDELLRSAAYEGNIREVQRLLASGTPVDAPDKEGWTPLMWAQAGEQAGVMELLLTRGAEVNAQDRSGHTALHQAALAGRVIAVKVLLAHGAEAESVNRSGCSPLMDASLYGRTVTVELLLAYGADPNVVNVNGHTAVSLAEQRGHRHVAMLLVANGADPHLQSKRLRTALAGMHSRTRGPSGVRLAGYMRNPEILEDLCQECLSGHAGTQVKLVSAAEADMNGKLVAWCRQNGLGLGRDATQPRQDRGSGTGEDHLTPATAGMHKGGSTDLLRQAIETWAQIQAKHAHTHQRMRELSARGMSLEKLSSKEPLLQKAMAIWSSLQSEHPELVTQLMSLAGMGR